METCLLLQNITDNIAAGDELLGELIINSEGTLTDVSVEFSVICRENVNFRSLDNGTTHCSDKVAYKKSKHCQKTLNFDELNGHRNSVKFLLDLPKSLQPSCYIEGFGDMACIEYSLVAKLSSGKKKLLKTSSVITVLPCESGMSSVEHSVSFRGCCLNYGTLSIATKYPRVSWGLQDLVSIELGLNNSNSSVRIIGLSFELWKHIKLRDKESNFESCSTLIHRGNEQLNLGHGKSLTAEGNVNLSINLKQCSGKLENHVTSIGELICCEYIIKFVIIGKVMCGLVEASFSCPIVIRN